ncbi:dTDP-4-dehydrorhamnose reductase [Prauserella marina]|uniref:dTDP-4-dehydrorhamnose reductase n=1 Tax=Prauserella marina TaxID=530584 RepID=A0A222VK22_9PSEU|nr:dTDP-4-dehydrorhamnose reductase [Prauserella marina]ASR34276.1 dTDP-4-dehydrorhamnose reductase [Prauserella marina]PWV71951.1 dTDP-4-dehydrorhamnose reductase [Prauserella marina]SDD91755.1 dTDP-4-dehydrorhamnose reductase [Prauserella marina]
MSRLAVLVPGGTGQLGSDLAASSTDDVEVTAPGSAELDVKRAGAVVEAVAELAGRAKKEGRFPVVVNAAAYTAVDAAEDDEARAFAVNADGPRVLAAACSSWRVPLVHVSTDYVFSGEAERPYLPEDPLSPRSAYGRTKAAGEDAVLGSGASAWVVRTAWVYGERGGNFVKTMTRLEGERDVLSVVDDQRGSPTWSADLAAGLLELAGKIADGEGPSSRILHCTGGGETSWFEFARAIFEELGADPGRVKPCTTAEFPRPAARPAYSVLSDEPWRAAGLTPLRPWRDALGAYFARVSAARR